MVAGTVVPDQYVLSDTREGLPEALQAGTRAFLARHGCRVAAEMDLGLPRWADDPAPVFSTLISYVDAADTGFDAPTEFAAAAREGRAKVAELVRRVPPGKLLHHLAARFLLSAAREGGMISHGTTVAREYGIPAVVGAAGATTRIQDGRLITVDGSRGTISLGGRQDPCGAARTPCPDPP
ncbi:PEP-utilizing enzyme [Nonomuraea sp. NPDC050547]|uniref:PEP-utilizing enzyme n=1 Tax=Nonomuraea sp. NPDC050547 TaxID=3364368 RepID=UPI0037B7F56D